MPIRITKIPDFPILVVHAIPAVESIAQETEDAINEIAALLEQQPEPVYLIMDLRDIHMDLDDILHSANLSARGRSAVLRHPNIREGAYVLGDGLIKMAIKGLESATFGRIHSPVFDTLEEAVAHYRRQSGISLF